ncbi:MAG: O-antigen ligase family protein [Bryobacteraceae bacterium]
MTARLTEWALLLLLATAVIARGGTPALVWSGAGAAVSLLVIPAALIISKQDLLRFVRWPAVFLLYVAASIPRSAAPARSAYYLAQWGAYVAAAAIAYACVKRGGGKVLGLGLISLAAAQSGFGLWQHLVNQEPDARGTYLNHNHFAGLLTMALAPALALAVIPMLSRKARVPVASALAALLLLGLIFSRSRMGLACAGLALLSFGSYLAVKGRGRIRAAWLGGVTAAALAYGAWIGLAPVGQRFTDLARPGYIAAEGRLTIWRDTWQLVKQRPLMGWGPGAFPSLYPTVRTEPSELRWLEAHSDYLQVLCESGAIGLLLLFGPLFALIGALLRQAWSSPGLGAAWSAALASSLAGILAHSAVDFHWYVPANALWIAAIAGLAAAELAAHSPSSDFITTGSSANMARTRAR